MKKINSSKIFATLALAACLPFLQPSFLCAADEKKMPECTMAADGKLTGADGKPMGDCMVMKEGKMHMYHDGKLTVMHEEMKMADGSRCLPDGTCISKAGVKTQLQEGDVQDFNSIRAHIKGWPGYK